MSFPSSQLDLGLRIRTLRKERNLSLARLAELTALSEATLSRIENGLSDVSVKNLYALSATLGTRIEDFFVHSDNSGRAGLRSLTRAGLGIPFKSGSFESHLLAAELTTKKMTPFLNVTTARSVEKAGGLNSHPGEEFLFVLDGLLQLHTAFYQPVDMAPGDSIYFDAGTPHAYVAASKKAARFLAVTSQPATVEEPTR